MGLDLASGTITDGLRRLEPLFAPVLEALLERNRQSHYKQADETRWLVFVEQQGKVGFGWWLWVFNSDDTVVYLLDDSRSHRVPEDHYPAEAGGVLMVDRYSAYKAMAQVKDGTADPGVLLGPRPPRLRAGGQGLARVEAWALQWLQRIRELYRLNRQRLAPGAADLLRQEELRQAVAAMRQQLDTELADPALRMPVRKVLTSLQEHWSGLTLFVEDPRIPMDNNRSERRLAWAGLGAEELLRLRGVVEWPTWPRRCFPSWRRSSCGGSIHGCGCSGICKVVPRPEARRQRTSSRSCRGICPKRDVRAYA